MIPLVANAGDRAKTGSGGGTFDGGGCRFGGLGGIGGLVGSLVAADPDLLVLTAILCYFISCYSFVSAEEACYFDCYLQISQYKGTQNQDR